MSRTINDELRPRRTDEEAPTTFEASVIRTTDAAVLCSIPETGGEHWIPKSVIHDDSEVYDKGHTGKLIIKAWFAVKLLAEHVEKTSARRPVAQPALPAEMSPEAAAWLVKLKRKPAGTMTRPVMALIELERRHLATRTGVGVETVWKAC